MTDDFNRLSDAIASGHDATEQTLSLILVMIKAVDARLCALEAAAEVSE